MKFPSIKILAQSAADTLKRFPFEMLFAFTGTVAAITWIELNNINPTGETWSLRVMMTANLGLLISLAATLYSESKSLKRQQRLILKLIAALLGASLILIINPFTQDADKIRFFLLSLALHLLVAFAAFIAPGQIQGFWQFNKSLFLRFLTSMLYSVVLFAGIAGAISAMNFLFNFEFESDSYGILWVLIAGIFNTMFFLSGVPGNVRALDADYTYPKGLKIFTQYVLIPLATLYLVILLAYEVKILVQWNLPKGLVSNLILSYAVFGILALLLVFPIRDREENKWIKTYARSFYFLMLPLIVLLFLAVGTRIFRYGITEYRYFLILLAVWLLLITVYFLVSRKQNIKLIPISLCVLTLLSIYGPQSAFSVSMFSQRRILTGIFERNKAFKNGKLMAVDSIKISAKDGDRAVIILKYLIEHYDTNCLQPLFNQNLKAVSDSISGLKSQNYGSLLPTRYELKAQKQDWFKRHLGLNRFTGYSDDGYNNNRPDTYYATIDASDIINVKGYDFMMDLRNRAGDTTITRADDINIQAIVRHDSVYTISINNQKASFHLKPFINNLFKDSTGMKRYIQDKKDEDTNYRMPAEMLSLNQQTKSYFITLKMLSIRFQKDKKTKQVNGINYVNSVYLVKIK